MYDEYMNRFFVGLIVVILLAGGAWYWFAMRPGVPPATLVTTTPPTLSADIYPLYDHALWNDSQAEQFTIGTTSYSGASIASAAVTNTMDPGSVFTPFQNYYDQKLKALGWQVANDVAAGGHTGGQTGYRKGDALVLTRFQIVYHNVTENAPSECPCDVTLSLFSSEAK